MKHWIITGRLCGEEEDTAMVLTAELQLTAVTDFKWGLYEVAGMSEEEAASEEADGRGVFVNCIACSDSPIIVC